MAHDYDDAAWAADEIASKVFFHNFHVYISFIIIVYFWLRCWRYGFLEEKLHIAGHSSAGKISCHFKNTHNSLFLFGLLSCTASCHALMYYAYFLLFCRNISRCRDTLMGSFSMAFQGSLAGHTYRATLWLCYWSLLPPYFHFTRII